MARSAFRVAILLTFVLSGFLLRFRLDPPTTALMMTVNQTASSNEITEAAMNNMTTSSPSSSSSSSSPNPHPLFRTLVDNIRNNIIVRSSSATDGKEPTTTESPAAPDSSSFRDKITKTRSFFFFPFLTSTKAETQTPTTAAISSRSNEAPFWQNERAKFLKYQEQCRAARASLLANSTEQIFEFPASLLTEVKARSKLSPEKLQQDYANKFEQYLVKEEYSNLRKSLPSSPSSSLGIGNSGRGRVGGSSSGVVRGPFRLKIMKDGEEMSSKFPLLAVPKVEWNPNLYHPLSNGTLTRNQNLQISCSALLAVVAAMTICALILALSV